MGCVLAGIGSMRAESLGVTGEASDHGLFAAAGLRGGLEIRVSSILALRPQVDLLGALSRPSLEFNGQTLWTAPPLSGSVGLAAVARFGG
jgi:hypothetical protein